MFANPPFDSVCPSSQPVVVQVSVEQAVQAAVEAEVDEARVEVQAQRWGVVGEGVGGLHHAPGLAQPPQQLLKVSHLSLDKQPLPGEGPWRDGWEV